MGSSADLGKFPNFIFDCRHSQLLFAGVTARGSLTPIISPSIALFTLFFSLFLEREKFEKSTLLIILLGAAGVFVVVNPFQAHNVANPYGGETWANMLNVASAASYAFYAFYLALAGPLPAQIATILFSLMFFFYGFLLNLVVLGGYVIAIENQWLPSPTTALLPSTFMALPTSFRNGLASLLLGATVLTYFFKYVGYSKSAAQLRWRFCAPPNGHRPLAVKANSARRVEPAHDHGSPMILSAIVLLTFFISREAETS